MSTVLVVNAGSSTLKLRLLGDADQVVAERTFDHWDHRSSSDDLATFLVDQTPDAVGHRVVHGGDRAGPALIDDQVAAELDGLCDLAPLHQPPALRIIDHARQLLPNVPHVACFDTSLHAGLPAPARTYALPAPWRERWGLRRYGFHGLSHSWTARRAPELLGRDPAGLRTVSCHLGSGASACAIVDGRSVDTTMGFSPLEGLVMATRSGSVDPGLLLWLIEPGRLSRDEVADGLQQHAGLAGLSGTGGDLRDVLSALDRGEGPSRLAFDVYAHRLRQAIAAMAASLGGLDVLAFTGGIGEHQPPVRSAAVDGLGFLGLELDPDANDDAEGDSTIGTAGSPVAIVVVTSREDLEIAGQVRAVVGGGG